MPPRRVRQPGPFSDYFDSQPQWVILLECCVLILLIGYVDYITGYEISLVVFYALPIMLAVWYGSRAMAIVIALFCTVTWSLADLGSGHPYSAVWIAAWDIWIRMLFFLFVVFGGGAIKAQLQQTFARLELLEPFHVLAKISPVGIFRTDVQGRCLYTNQRWSDMAGSSSPDRSLQEPWTKAIHPDDRERVEAEWMQAVEARTSFPFECRFHREDNNTAWVLGRIAPEVDSRGEVRGYVGAITEMTDHRRLETEVLEISEREQRRIGQDLHDGLCQDLAAIQFAASSLKGDLQTRQAPERDAALEIVELLRDAIVQTRNLARAIFPVKLERIGLASALEELARTVSHIYRISCQFETRRTMPVYDHASATHLYRIAQEAVNNAIKHGEAKNIVILLGGKEDRLTLSVQSDGVDFPKTLPTGEGMGLNIMRYRARMIGAMLRVEKGQQGGTLVTCTLRQQPAEATLEMPVAELV